MKFRSSQGGERARRGYIVRCSTLLLIIALFVAVCFYGALEPVIKGGAASQKLGISKDKNAGGAMEIFNSTAGGEGDQDGDGSVNRVGVGGTECSKDSILVFQGPTAPMPNGIPTYTVEIHNVCLSDGCAISDIHMSCGWFSSARLVNPKVFRRVSYNDCLVNDGGPLDPGDTLSFQYANTFQYPLSVSSVSC